MNTLEILKKAFKGKTATSVYTIDEHPNLVAVQYHDTRIAVVETLPSSIRVRLNNGGWKTVTTKRRFNEVLDALGIEAHVFQRGGFWFVEDQSGVYDYENAPDGRTIERAI